MIPLLLSLGIPARLHKAALIGAGVILLVAGAFLALHLHDNSVRKADRAATEAAVAKRALAAERTANRADVARQAEIQANDATTRKAIDDAAAKDPEGAKSPAGPVTRAATDELRKRQSGNKHAAD
jgi:hypothetical protein